MGAERRFGIGVVGAGMAARPHVLALAALQGLVEVRGVYRRDATARAAFCAEYGLPPADSVQALLVDPMVDALLVLTPPNARQEVVAAAARAGKHVLMEKPVERTTAAAERLVEVCSAAGIKLGIMFQHRFRPAARRLAALLQEDALGALQVVHLAVPWWRPQAYYDQPGRGTLEQDGGGVLITQAIHQLDLMLSLTGPVASVAAIAATTGMHRMQTEDFVGAGLRFASGAAGALMATTALFPGGAETLVLGCERATATLGSGTLTLDWLDGRHEHFGGEPVASGGGADPMAFPFAWHKAAIAEFVAAVRAGREPLPSGRDALAAHRLIDALLASSREGREVRVVR
ncbi:Gfo/Idh/MocA family protein [Devosia sp.]|uniref:Gfo/Idh/MocA family protein n=1 Tax=Devosia sp. TaxID=1871048 RepID=UPI002F078C4D